MSEPTHGDAIDDIIALLKQASADGMDPDMLIEQARRHANALLLEQGTKTVLADQHDFIHRLCPHCQLQSLRESLALMRFVRRRRH